MAQVANVGINIDARQPLAALRRLKDKTKELVSQIDKVAMSNRKLNASYERLSRKGLNTIRDLEKNTNKLAKATGGLTGALGKAAIAYAAIRATQAGIRRVESERRLKLLASSYGEVAQLQQAAAASARKFKVSQTEANQAIANAYGRLRPLGVSLGDITSTFNGFRTAAVLGGATAEEAGAAFTQLSQALGSGALRGDEFRSIAEQAPLVLKAISDETGIATGALKDYAAEGLLTSDIVIKALKRIETEGAAKLEEALSGPAAAIQEFQNATQDVQVALTTSVIPQLSKAFRDLAQVIRDLKPAIDFIGGLLGGLARTVGSIVEGIRFGGKALAARKFATQAAERQTTAKFGAPGFFGRSAEAQKFFEETQSKELERRMAMVRGAVYGQLPPSANQEITTTATTPLPQLTSTSEETKKRGRTGPDPAKELEQRLKALQRIQTAAQRENELRQQTTDLDSDLLQISYKYRDLQSEIAEIVGTSKDAQVLKLQEELQSLLGINEEEERRGRIIEERQKEFKKMSDQQKPIEDKLTTFIKSAQDRLTDLQQVAINISQGIGDAVANSLTNGIQGLIDGSQKVKDVFANLLQSVGQILAQEGAKMIATYIAIGIAKIFAGLGGGGYGSGAEKPLTSGMDFSSAFSSGGFGIAPRANGGPVNRNSAYVVGENGPELFVPGQAGRIESNSDTRSMMSRQRGTAPAMNFTFETTNIGGQEFVSREQLEAAMAVTRRQAASDGAKRGMNMTLDKMQQSPATRRRIGIS